MSKQVEMHDFISCHSMSDFVILGPTEHDLPGLVHLLGIESPGLTSSLAIADEVVSRLNL